MPDAQDAGNFDCNDLSNLNMPVFPTADEAFADLQKMVAFGPRHTASQADQDYISFLHQRMVDAGLQNITLTPITVQSGPNGLDPNGPSVSNLNGANHLHGFIPSSNDSEIIILGVHSDGQNSIEENGTVTLLHVAEYLAKVPMQCRKHTFALVFVTCHMATCANAEAAGWSSLFPDITQKAVAYLAPEHQAHKAGPQGQIINWVAWSNVNNFQTKAEAFRQTLGITASVGPNYSAPGTGSGWQGASGGKPVFAGMADALTSGSNGLLSVGPDTTYIDKQQFWLMNVWLTKMAGHIDGLTAAQMRM